MTQKILLAEDDATMVSLLKTLLKMEGFQVILLDANADVPAVVLSEHPDIVLLDVHLSHQNGLEILASIRNGKETKTIPVVMTSGEDVKEECIQLGANAFLLKPYMPDDLIKMLRSNIIK